MELQLSDSCPFNLDSTLNCGQAFRWSKRGRWWYGIVRGKVFKIRQTHNKLEMENVDVGFAKNYFGLHDDLLRIIAQTTRDRHVAQAFRKHKGLRILRQEPWECLISYMCATYKNIPAIRKMLFNLSKRFGEEATFNDVSFHTFPAPARLAKASIKTLIECGLGYRAKYIHETARMIHEEECELEELKRKSHDKARETLLAFPGVGLKVADCILLFSLDKMEAFPVDVWVKRIMMKYYSDYVSSELKAKLESKHSLTRREYESLNMIGRKHFGKYAGYAQEYLYHNERTLCQN